MRRRIFIAVSMAAVVFMVPSVGAQGAPTLYLDPATSIIASGDIFDITIRANTHGTAVNAAEAELQYDASIIEVIDVTSEGSVMSFWSQDPDYSNTDGRIFFAGGTTQPFSGNGGELIRVSLRAMKAGTARITFRYGALLAADGRGTNIVEQMRAGVFTLVPQNETPAAEQYVPLGNAPAAPVVSSPSHPDADTWYSERAAEFRWSVPNGVTAVRTLLDGRSDSIPTVVHGPDYTSALISDLDDGVWYFHVQLQNEDGWGGVAHRMIRIDATKPASLTIALGVREDATDPRIPLQISASDNESGISFYEIYTNDGVAAIWDGGDLYTTSPLRPGEHTLVVRAYDMAENWRADSLTVSVAALAKPEFVEYPRHLENERILEVRGTALPGTDVVLLLQPEGRPEQRYTVPVDDGGEFVYISEERLSDGLYGLSAFVRDGRGAQSNMTEPITISVREPFVVRVGSRAVNILSVLVPLLALLLLLAFVLWYAWHRFVGLRKKLRKEVVEAERVLHVQHAILRRDIAEHMEHLHQVRASRALTEEEHRFMETFSKHIATGESRIEEAIEMLEKELE